MFGDLQGMMQQMQEQMDAHKRKLDDIIVHGESGGVKVSCTGNRKITDISISSDLLSDGDKEALEDLVLSAVNRALEEAGNVHEATMKGAASGMLPNLPGLFGE